jgi:hypothetical protein
MVFLLSVSFLALRTLPPLSQEHQPELRRFTAEDTNNEGWNTSPRSCLLVLDLPERRNFLTLHALPALTLSLGQSQATGEA